MATPVHALQVARPHILAPEPRLATIRSQSAIVRMLVDELEHALAGTFAEASLREQLVEELTRLATQMLETAAAMNDESRRAPHTLAATPRLR